MITILSDTDEDAILTPVDYLSQKIQELYKKFIIEKMTIGLHQNASRIHYHFGLVIDTGDKELKHWDKYFSPLLNEVKKTIKGEKNLKTTHRINITEDDEFGVLAYPLKEYECISKMKFICKFIGLNDEEIEALRKFSHDKYRKAKYDASVKEKKKIEEEENTENKYKYIEEQLSHLSSFHGEHPVMKLRIVCAILLEYQKLQYNTNQKRSFKSTCIKDLAQSYLINENHITPLEFVEYIMKL